ncbi:hypothetical protein, partial [Pseudoalteromonas rubra]
TQRNPFFHFSLDNMSLPPTTPSTHKTQTRYTQSNVDKIANKHNTGKMVKDDQSESSVSYSAQGYKTIRK